MKPWLLPSLCVAVIMLTLAGCSPYEPKIRTGNRLPPMRTLPQITEDGLKLNSDFVADLQRIKDAEAAKKAIPKIKDYYSRTKAVVIEGIPVEARQTPEEKTQFERQYGARLGDSLGKVNRAVVELQKVKGLPRDVLQAIDDGRDEVIKAMESAKNLPAAPPPEVLPDKPPDSSSWAVWLLCLLILAVCVAFLFRDGLWSNALGLVNVVFAGLLAMNFYEWLANFLTKYSESLHPYVAFFDFLALWICFVLFAVIFRAATDAVSKVRVRFLQVVDLWGGVVLSLCIGWVMVGFTLVSLHAAPLGQYPLFGSFQPQNSMFFGMFAPDREWLGFTKYQSSGPFCRSVEEKLAKRCEFPPDFIEKQLERRMHIEKYIDGNPDHAILVNPKFITAPARPAAK